MEITNGMMTVNLSLVVGSFQLHIIEVMVNLQEINISGCSIDPNIFTETIIKCTKLEKIVMMGCKQFSEYKY